MTEEPAEGDEGEPSPTEADVEAAKEELEAVGEGTDEDGTDDGPSDDSAPDDEDVVPHAEDLVEDPEDRAVGGTDGPEDISEDGAAAAVEQVEPAEPDEEPAADGAEQAADAESETGEGTSTEAEADEAGPDADQDHQPGVPADVRTYDRFTKMDGAQYDRVNEFLRDRTYVTAREWAIARLCSDFRTETGVEMTKIGENLPELVPFMTDTYTAQAVNQARSSFEDKVRTAGATFLYGAMCDFFTAEELDDVMYEATEVAKFLLEVEGVELTVEEELEAEDRISAVMRDVRESSAELRHEECPECGARLHGGE